MTEEELLEIEKAYTESKLQHICVQWYRQTFPLYDNLLISIPNGGWRGARAGAQMKYEGQVRGASDLILLRASGGSHALCIEMKVPKRQRRSAGQQSPHQRAWQLLVERNGYRYAVCHGLAEFIRAVCRYLQLDADRYVNDALNKYPLYR